ncbi:MAG: ABC transporter substrate-binding protein [Thermodesulfobacteriota bacterium]|nr:ABC transporter substrate-binding protein [Thermodesulfobacteriota bacterium]
MIHRWMSLILAAIGLITVWCTVALGAAEMALDGEAAIDAGGRRLVMDTPYRRIISLYGAHSENLCALGAADQVIGIAASEAAPPELQGKPRYSARDDLEKFLAASPDLVLIRPMIDRGYSQLVNQLEKHGVTVASLQPATIDQMFVYWRILGLLSGHRGQAEEMIERFSRTVETIRMRTAVIANKKRVYFEAIHEHMRTFSPSAMPIFALETAGGINVAKDAAPRRGTNIADFGKERILSRADEIDVYLAQVGPMNRPSIAQIKSEPGFGLIRAVREDRVYLIDEELVSRPSLRLIEGICQIGRTLYPEIFLPEAEWLGCAVDKTEAGPTIHKEIHR